MKEPLLELERQIRVGSRPERLPGPVAAQAPSGRLVGRLRALRLEPVFQIASAETSIHDGVRGRSEAS